MAEIKLIALDLDGTLLNEKKEIPPENEKALRECAARGIQIVPATGRTVYGIPDTIRDIPGVRYAIIINGGKVVDMQEDREISSCLLSKEKTVEIMEIAERFPIMYDAYVEGRGVSEERFLDHMDDYGISPGIQELVKRTRDRYPNIIGHIKELETSVEKVTMFFKTPQDKRNVREALKGVKDIIVSSSLPNNLEVNAAGATKGGGLLRLAEYLGISAAQTMAFGDGENDITMIESAGCGVVMENGAPFLKEKADYITLSNEEAGVAAAIKKLVLEDGTPISPMEGDNMEMIMENWLSVGTAVFLIGMMLYGHYRGFIRQAVAIGALVAAIIITNLLMPQVKAALQQNTQARDAIKNILITSVISGDMDDTVQDEPSGQRSYIEDMDLPDQLKNNLLTNNNSEVYEILGVDRFADYIGAYLSNMILSGLAYIVVFLAVTLDRVLIMRWLDLIAKLPILSGLNQIAGAGLGLAEGLLLIWIGCLLLTVFAGTSGGIALLHQIEKSAWLSFLYDNNFLMHIAMGILHGKL